MGLQGAGHDHRVIGRRLNGRRFGRHRRFGRRGRLRSGATRCENKDCHQHQTDQAGPFSYVPTSNRFMINKLQQMFGRSITTGSYCHTPDARRSVFRLPKQLRVSYNFGRLLLDNTDLSKKILQEHIVYTTDKANCVAFDPGAGIHRGAFCKSKNRVALQVLMK